MATRGLMVRMEQWTEKETPKIVSGHQTHYPITEGGGTLKKPRKTSSSGGRKNTRRVWWEVLR